MSPGPRIVLIIRYMRMHLHVRIHLQDSLFTVKHSYSHHPYCCYVYIPGTTRLHIPLAHPSCSYYYLLSPNILFFAHLICVALFILLHILLFMSLFLPIYMLLCCVTFIYFFYFLFCTVH